MLEEAPHPAQADATPALTGEKLELVREVLLHYADQEEAVGRRMAGALNEPGYVGPESKALKALAILSSVTAG